MINKKLLILTEAGDEIGFGHYSRCLALQEFFIEQHCNVQMLLNVEGSFSFENVNILNWQIEKETVQKYSSKYPYLLIDSYLFDNDFCDFASKNFEKVIVIDDYNRLKYSSIHTLINPNIYGNEIPYFNKNVLAGKDYVILRKPFRENNQSYLVKPRINKVLITVGGSDTRNFIPSLIELLSKSSLDLIIVSGSISYEQELQKRFGSLKCKIHGYVNAREMQNIMLDSDVAISACGQTLHELSYLGIPTIGICTGDDQIKNMKKYVEISFLTKELYWSNSNVLTDISESFELIQDYNLRIKMSAIGKNFIDGKGVLNIFNKIFSQDDKPYFVTK